MAETTFAEFLVARLERAGFGADHDHGHERFRVILVEKYAVPASPQAMSHWRTGRRVPTLGTVLAMLDALAIFGDDRDRALRLAAGTQEPEQPTEAA